MKFKFCLVVLICLLLFPLAGKVIMNKSGRIETVGEEIQLEYTFEDNEYYIYTDALKLVGNVLFRLRDGYLTLVTEHENFPTWLRIYDKKGSERFRQNYTRTINLTLSENSGFAAFSTGKSTLVIDLESLEIFEYPNSVSFAVDNSGFLAYMFEDRIYYRGEYAEFDGIPQKIIFGKNKLFLFTSKHLYLFEDGLKELYSFTDSYFDADINQDILYLVERIGQGTEKQYRLLQSTDLMEFKLIQTISVSQLNNRTHTPIPSPLLYGTDEHAFPIGNSYAEHQWYGGDAYLHPGVDFLGDDYQEVYAVHYGFVKAVLTTGGNAYWRIAVANEDTAEETEGYLYAHLNQNSITVNVGDEVSAGDLLGTLYPWNYYDFTHLHFARIRDQGNIWYGNWWTIDNPLPDVTNLQDTIPPVFENTLLSDKFAFRTADGEYLDPYDLHGEFDIIVKCHDICNSDWRIDVWDINFSLNSAVAQDSILYELFSCKFDMPLDTYFGNYWTNLALNTIYSQDEICQTVGNYDTRDFYHIITNSDGDSLITEEDAEQVFDSSQYADGFYYFKVIVRDASLNMAADSMMVYFNNGVHVDNNVVEQIISLSNYPNPFNSSGAGRNPGTTISFRLTTGLRQGYERQTDVPELTIYNLKGQKVKTFPVTEFQSQTVSLVWDGTDQNNCFVPGGVYLYRLKTGTCEKVNKMILLK